MLLPSYLAVMVFAGNAMVPCRFYELTFYPVWDRSADDLCTAATDQSVCSVLFNKLHDERRVFQKRQNWYAIFSAGAKLVLTIVVGLNVVQGMIAPAVDYASRTTLTKSLSLIPGIGGVAAAIGDIFIGSGMVIKNSVGVAAMFLLIFCH